LIFLHKSIRLYNRQIHMYETVQLERRRLNIQIDICQQEGRI